MFLIDKVLGAVVHIPLTSYALNLDRWSQMEGVKWRYFRIVREATVTADVDGKKIKYPRFRWTPLVKRIRRLDV